MARPRSAHTVSVKEKLIARLRDGFHRPGQRFFSNRALCDHFQISYQTAHRLIAELQAEGWLERRPASGTYVAGPTAELGGAQLIFHPRSRKADSFGARLLAELRAALTAVGIKADVAWGEPDLAPRADRLPVFWECPELAAASAAQRRFVVQLNDRPPPGLAANFVDSVSTDDFSGGAAAAELLRQVAPARRLAVLAGPRGDRRSQQRVAGFQTQAAKAGVYWADTWYAEDAARLAPRLVSQHWGGVFCCNDRLAEAFLAACARAKQPAPPLVGFDDAPVAERLNLTTIAIPWREIVAGAVEVVQRRLAGATGPAAQLIFTPRPVFRATLPARRE
ncbi:MAG: substrate-binding domain-containing protein [Opitutae bacterium]|nr:substrate-binding domain-containing protein [Opitutae bacterium]